MHSSYAFPESFTHDVVVVVVVAEPRSEVEEEEITIFSPSLRKLRDVMLFLLKARKRFKIEQQKSTRANAFTNDTLRFLKCCLFFFLLLEEEDDSNSGASLIIATSIVVDLVFALFYLFMCACIALSRAIVVVAYFVLLLFLLKMRALQNWGKATL